MPHMHLRGRSFRYEAIFPDRQNEILSTCRTMILIGKRRIDLPSHARAQELEFTRSRSTTIRG